MPKKILLAGYYGFGNLGDELLLKTHLSKLAPHFDVTVLMEGHDPEIRNAVDRWSPLKIISAVRNCDILVFGGGGILQDKSGFLSFFYYVSLILLARFFGKKTVLLGQGIGPLNPVNARIARTLLKRADFVSVRDRDSLKLIEGQARLSADAVLLCDAQAPVSKNLNPKPRILFIPGLDGMINDIHKRTAIEGVERFAREIGGQVETLAFQPQNAWKTPQDAFGKISSADFVVSLRLHGLILSSLLKKPFAGISMDPKIDSFIREFDFGETAVPRVLLDNATAESISQKLLESWHHKERLLKAVETGLPGLKSRAQTDFEGMKGL